MAEAQAGEDCQSQEVKKLDGQCLEEFDSIDTEVT